MIGRCRWFGFINPAQDIFPQFDDSVASAGEKQQTMVPNMFAASVGMILIPCIYCAFSEEQTKTMPKENIFEFASSRNMLNGDYGDKRGFWDKRGYGDKRSDISTEYTNDGFYCKQNPWSCLTSIMKENDKDIRSLFFDKRGYGDKAKRGFWDKRGFGNRRELIDAISDRRIGRFFPFMYLPNSA